MVTHSKILLPGGQGRAEDFFTRDGDFFRARGARKFSYRRVPGKFLTAPPIFAFYLGW